MDRYDGPSGVNKEGHCRWCGKKLGWAPQAQISRTVQDILDHPGKHSQGMIDWAVQTKGGALEARAKNARGLGGEGKFCGSKCCELFGGFFARSGYAIVWMGVGSDGKDSWGVCMDSPHRQSVVVDRIPESHRAGKPSDTV